MRLTSSNISCGLYELADVGQDPTDADYRSAMEGCDAAIVIASVPAYWTNAVKFLKKKGFKQPLRQNENPNSGNRIVLLARNITAKDRQHFNSSYGYCEDCGAELPPRRRVCDNCKDCRKEDRRRWW